MEPNPVMQTALVTSAISTAGDFVMAAIRSSGKPHPPITLAMLHGLLFAAALALLVYAAWTAGESLAAFRRL